MKNKIKILYAVVSVLTFIGISSCNNDEFLTVDHYSILPADQMFKSDEDAKAGLVGCYDLMLPSGDVANQVAAMLVNEDSVANIEQLSNVAQELAKRYKNTPRDIANVIAYLAEVLDLPPVELSQVEQDLLTKLTEKLVTGKLAVVNIDDETLKQGLPAFADKHNGGFSFNSKSGCFIRFSDNKQMLFTSDDQNVIRAEIDFDEGVVVAKALPAYAVQDLINDVNATMETPYKIKLMEERENVTLDNITEEKVLQYLDKNKNKKGNDKGRIGKHHSQ
jgi:hypothetical protein